MAKLLTSNGVGFFVDDDLVEKVSKYKWSFSSRYIQCRVNRKTLRLHHLILGSARGKCVDHINGDACDNRRSNLRFCTHAENIQNRKPNRNASLPYKGIQQLPSGRFRVRVGAFGKRKNYGTFSTLEEANRQRQKIAKQLHGEFYHE